MMLPFAIPNSNRLLDPTTPLNSTTNFLPVAPPAGVAAVAQLTNVMTNFGWEYVWHCHMLGHEENDFMRPVAFLVAPGAPTIGTATAGNTQATVSFTAPVGTGGSPITSYTATSNPGGLTATGAASPITVTGLTVGTAYTFTVTATNAIGTGAASAASNSITAVTTPGAPTIGTATSRQRTGNSDLYCACIKWRQRDYIVHSNLKPRRHNGHRNCKPDNGNRADKRHCLYIHCNGNEHHWNGPGISRF